MKSFGLKSRNGNVHIGYDYPIRVNCNVGINNAVETEGEKAKLAAIFSKQATTPDMMVDLSTIKSSTPLYKHIIDDYGIPAGTLPTYTSYDRDSGISRANLITQILRHAESGVSFFTFHFTADSDLYEKSMKMRKIPTTSRGGGLVLADAMKNKRKENVLRENIEEIIAIAKEYNIAISLGTTFRPAGIVDACDEVHIEETRRQLDLCRHLQSVGVNVIVENVGHIDIASIEKHATLLRGFDAPIMPLGPIVTDNAIGNDHVAASIGIAFAGYFRCAHIVNAIPPCEHLKAEISTDDTIAGIVAAKIAAHSVNILRFPRERTIDSTIYDRRADAKSCLCHGICKRCSHFCPLKLSNA